MAKIANRQDWYQQQARAIDEALVSDEMNRADRLQLLVLSGILRGLIEHAEETAKLSADVASIKDTMDAAAPLVTASGAVKAIGVAILAGVGAAGAGAYEWLAHKLWG